MFVDSQIYGIRMASNAADTEIAIWGSDAEQGTGIHFSTTRGKSESYNAGGGSSKVQV